MPTYEYACTACGNEWEFEQSMKDDAIKECPKCKQATAKRQISRGTGFILKGGGWYSDAYSGSSNKGGGSGSGTSGGGGTTASTATSGTGDSGASTSSGSSEGGSSSSGSSSGSGSGGSTPSST